MSLYCERFHCPPEEFEKRAFRSCLYWRARLLAPLIRKFWPDFFNPDFELIRYLGKTPGRRDAVNEMAAYMEFIRTNGGFARKFLRFRISARKSSKLVEQLFGHLPRGGYKVGTLPPAGGVEPLTPEI